MGKNKSKITVTGSKKNTITIKEDEFYSERQKAVHKLKESGVEVYPHSFECTHSYEEIFCEAEKAEPGEKNTEKTFQTAGRISQIRDHKTAKFIVVKHNQANLQLTVIKDSNSELSFEEQIKRLNLQCNLIDDLKRNDIIGFTGHAGRSSSGEKTLFLTSFTLLAPSLRLVPSVKNKLTDVETLYRKRYLDLLLNQESKDRFLARSDIIKHIRGFMHDKGYIEVETPILNPVAGGATARPFKTYHNELKQSMDLRIAPELYLKELVVGGMNKVFEIGRVFRNEGIDLTHNPEFTSLEFYTSYSDIYDAMNFIENLLTHLVIKQKGQLTFTFKGIKHDSHEEVIKELDFTAPFKRYDILETLSKELGFELDGEIIEDPETLNALIQKCKDNNIELSEPVSLSRVLDSLIGHFIEPRCINPSFIVGHPVCMSPLAKEDRNRKGITERAELFVMGKELVNAYTELNMPDVQRERFKEQVKCGKEGDVEAMPADEDFCVALEYGLPPTSGVGIGIDRLVMVLTNTLNIRDVVLFPTMKPESTNATKK